MSGKGQPMSHRSRGPLSASFSTSSCDILRRHLSSSTSHRCTQGNNTAAPSAHTHTHKRTNVSRLPCVSTYAHTLTYVRIYQRCTLTKPWAPSAHTRYHTQVLRRGGRMGVGVCVCVCVGGGGLQLWLHHIRVESAAQVESAGEQEEMLDF